jgi:hypothetical protein
MAAGDIAMAWTVEWHKLAGKFSGAFLVFLERLRIFVAGFER